MEKSSPKILAASVIFKKNSTQRKQLPNMQKNRLILSSEQHL
jgi:ribosomal protein L28